MIFCVEPNWKKLKDLSGKHGLDHSAMIHWFLYGMVICEAGWVAEESPQLAKIFHGKSKSKYCHKSEVSTRLSSEPDSQMTDPHQKKMPSKK